MDFAIKAFGKLDSLIINHGVLKPMATIANASMDEWKYAYDVNLFSALALVGPGCHATHLPSSITS